ncbi:MAG: hypothetical protein ACE14V_10125 [bacterium]
MKISRSIPRRYNLKVKKQSNSSFISYLDYKKTAVAKPRGFLTQNEVEEIYGQPDWIGRKQTMLGLKIQWFYQLGAGKIRYVFFVDDQLIWDQIISEPKMLEVVYPDNELLI